MRAIRVLVDSVGECYTALGTVHGLWMHIPREFDDYVTNPKPNGYRSLHTAVVGPGGRTLEVQIRTREMHRQAELGVAAHWRYKEGAQRAKHGVDDRIAWLRQVLENRAEADEHGSPLRSLGEELDSERVYAFTPRGDIVDLPAGATPLDFAYQIHTQVGHRCRGAKVNGRIVQLTSMVRSGDRSRCSPPGTLARAGTGSIRISDTLAARGRAPRCGTGSSTRIASATSPTGRRSGNER